MWLLITQNKKLVDKEEETYAQVDSYVTFKSLALETENPDLETWLCHLLAVGHLSYKLLQVSTSLLW